MIRLSNQWSEMDWNTIWLVFSWDVHCSIFHIIISNQYFCCFRACWLINWHQHIYIYVNDLLFGDFNPITVQCVSLLTGILHAVKFNETDVEENILCRYTSCSTLALLSTWLLCSFECLNITHSGNLTYFVWIINTLLS